MALASPVTLLHLRGDSFYVLRNWTRFIALLVVALSTFAVANAQSTAAMTGVVQDRSGAVVPGAQVVLTNPRTGVKYTAKSDSVGAYRFPIVPPNEGYVLTVTHEGFATADIRNMTLQVGVTRTQDVKLDAGAATTVEVSAGSQEVTLNTTDNTVGNNFDVEQLNELPVQSRSSVAALFYLQPGVTSTGSVAGARTDQTQITLDGMDVNDLSTGQTFYSTVGAPVDAIQEFRGTVAGQPAANVSGGGGVFQLVVKNGTNKFHGNLNEYHRDPTTQATPWFTDNNVLPSARVKPKQVQNQFGGNIGGPIRFPHLYDGRDKAFFFFDFNNGRTAQTSNATRTVPTDTFRAGQIGYINNTAGCTNAARPSTAPQCISYLTPAQVLANDPALIGENATLFNYVNSRYPHVNAPGSAGDGYNTDGYYFVQKYLTNTYNYTGRLDFNLTSKQHLYIRGIYNHVDGLQALNQFDVDAQAGGGPTYPNQTRSYGYVISHVWNIGNNKVNQLYYGDTINVLNFPVNYRPTGITSFAFTPLTAPNGSLSSQGRRVPIPEVRDDFNWQVGKHTIQMGGTFKFIKTHSNLTNDYNFVTVGTGGLTTALNAALRPANILSTDTTVTSRFDSADVFSLGVISAQSRNYNYDAAGNAYGAGSGSQRAYRSYQTELYLGDTWKATPSLTLNYGIRWDLYTTPYEALGRQTNQNYSFDDYLTARIAQSSASLSGNTAVPFITYSLGGKANNAAPAIRQSYKDFAPRVGFSFNPQSHRNTVFNGGFGLTYDRTVYNALNFVQDQLSYFFANTQAYSYGGATPAASLASPAAGGDPRLGANLGIPAAPPPVTVSRATPFAPYVTGGVPVGITAGQTNYAIDNNFKSPYNLNFNLGMQQKIPGSMILSATYVGHLGRRLIGQADDSQLLDFRDPTSGQYMSQAFAALSSQIRNNPALCTAANFAGITKQPWFENQVGTVSAAYPSKSAYLAYNSCTTVQNGDFADSIDFLAARSLLAKNVGLPGQFAANTVITNKGYSAYHGVLVSLNKNMTHGLQFQLNYTFNHSTDNVSAIANTIGLSSGVGQICDALVRSSCYGNSDFDVKHTITSDFVYNLPFGRGRQFGSHINRFLDAAIGGWTASGIPGWRSGVAFGAYTGAYLAGYANNDPAVFLGNGPVKTNLHRHANGTAATQLFLFDDPIAANPRNLGTAPTGLFRNPLGFEYGSRNNLRGPGALTFDAGVGKRFQIVQDRVTFQLRGDAFNVLNHPTFATPSVTNINSANFGQITAANVPTGTNSGARLLQVSGRIEF